MMQKLLLFLTLQSMLVFSVQAQNTKQASVDSISHKESYGLGGAVGSFSGWGPSVRYDYDKLSLQFTYSLYEDDAKDRFNLFGFGFRHKSLEAGKSVFGPKLGVLLINERAPLFHDDYYHSLIDLYLNEGVILSFGAAYEYLYKQHLSLNLTAGYGLYAFGKNKTLYLSLEAGMYYMF
ncbi:MAG: hypothetical protein ACQES0_04110 [Bacteroidota bacterium]